MAVLDPVKLVLTNWDEVMGANTLDDCSAPVHPHQPKLGKRNFRSVAKCGLTATTLKNPRPRAFSGFTRRSARRMAP